MIIRILVFILFIPMFFMSCKGRPTISELEVTIDGPLTNLFIRDCCGFTGGDGTYSVALPDGRNAWIFGDTFIGSVNKDKSRKKLSPMYVRNSMVIQDGDSLTTLFTGTLTNYSSLVIHPAVQEENTSLTEDSIWFWPGDGFVEDNLLKVFLSEFTQFDTGMWNFKWEGTWLAYFTLPDIKLEKLERITKSTGNNVHYGHATYLGNEFTYVYGAKEGKPHVARYEKGNVHGNWEFYNGKTWCSNPNNSAPMVNVDGSEQFSVFKLNDKFVFITQMGSLSPDICSFVSDTPYGTWKNQSLLYSTPLPADNDNIFTYNALAHPQFIKDGSLLISYNTNSFILADHFVNADIYRPRFIRVPLKLIDPDF